MDFPKDMSWFHHGLDRQVFKLKEDGSGYTETYHPLPYDPHLSQEQNYYRQMQRCIVEMRGCWDDLHYAHKTSLPTLASLKQEARVARAHVEAPSDQDLISADRVAGVIDTIAQTLGS